MKLLIVGATGLVGKEAVKLALNDHRITQVIVLSRRAIAPHDKIKNVVVDFDKLDVLKDCFAVDAGICALGTTRKQTQSQEDYERIEVHYSKLIAKGIKEHGAHSFAYVSSLGASTTSRSWYLRLKAKAETELAKVDLPSLTIVRPSFISGQRDNARALERPLLAILQKLACVIPARIRPVSAQAIAQCMLNAVIACHKGTTIIESERIA